MKPLTTTVQSQAVQRPLRLKRAHLMVLRLVVELQQALVLEFCFWLLSISFTVFVNLQQAMNSCKVNHLALLLPKPHC
uniref:Uncharacterized protein n=1 Tax=Octopus bimaculoides TaxID=37653 RepID=A0A0L8I5B7_OCTBM